MTFSDLDLDPRILEGLDELSFTNPSPVQKQTIPSLLQNQNMIIKSPTGTGKTFAYLLPIFHHLLNAKIMHDEPTTLILVPTRELARQIYDVCSSFAKHLNLEIVAIYAGPREQKHKRDLDKHFIDILISTPGKLVDYVKRGWIKLGRIAISVLDEADVILEMGFADVMKFVTEALPHKNKRQSIIVGATISSNLAKFVKEFSGKIDMKEVTAFEIPKSISHQAIIVTEAKKFDILKKLLLHEKFEACIIFVSSIHKSRITSRNLFKANIDHEEIHSGLTQRQRNRAIENFTSGVVDILISTDIAARGIDIPEVTLIINFDYPKSFDDYLHRAGRTGRFGKSGKSILIGTEKNLTALSLYEKKIGKRINRVSKIAQFNDRIRYKSDKNKNRKFKKRR